MTSCVHLYRPGLIAYEDACRWQAEAVARVRAGGEESLALLQHPPVYTLGRRGNRENLLAEPALLAENGADVFVSDRGGDVTFHGPGQLVAYPILDLRRRRLGPVDYVRCLEQVMIEALSSLGIAAARSPGRPGAWSGRDKLGAIGVRVQGGVASHGFALNVETDLSWFDAIVPCGLRDAGVTSIARLLGFSPGVAAMEEAVVRSFERVFASRLMVGSGAAETVGAGGR